MKKTTFPYAKTVLTMMFFASTKLVLAGQFDALHGGFNQIETWNQFFPGLEDKINAAFEEAKKTGNFIFHSNAAPVAWNIAENGDIYINSINVGYFKNRYDPVTHKPLFPGLTVESQNINISAGNNLIVTPVPVEEQGFGYALSVDPDQKVNIRAQGQIVFMVPQDFDTDSFFDELSIALSEGSSAELQAQQILIFGGISAQHGSQLKMVGNSGIYFLSPSEKLETSISTIQLMGSQMSMDAPDILIDRTIQIGQVIFGQGYPSVLNIGKDPSLTGFTKNVYFTKKVDVERDSQLNVSSENAAIFQDHLNLIQNAQANVESRQIAINKLFLGNLGAHAKFLVNPNGYMYVNETVLVGINSQLTIDLGENSVLSSVFKTHKDGQSNLNLQRNSYWFVPQSSTLSTLSVEPDSYIQLGQSNTSVQVEMENLKGSGSYFYLPAGATGALNITESSEGKHTVLLGSTGSSLSKSGYLNHVIASDASPDGQDKAQFSLANDGIIDAGPYEYKLGLYPFKQGDSRVWAILGTQTLKPIVPIDPSPPEENIPKPDLPDLPFNPNDPPQIDNPIGLSPAAKLTLASVSSVNHVAQFLGSLEDLRGRVGEIREGVRDGIYALYRHDQSRFNSSYSTSSKFKYSAVTFGADNKINPNWLIGANLILTRGKIRIHDASGSGSRIESIGAKVYAAWIGDRGQYVDSVVSLNRYKNELHAQNLDESSTTADYCNYGLGLSFEVGHRLKLLEDPKGFWFIEPQIQLSYFRTTGNSFHFSNDMSVHAKAANSLNGRIGIDVGKSFYDADGKALGQIYLKGGVNHEFLGKSVIQMNEFSFKDHSIGTRFYYGLGGEINIQDRVKAFAQITRESGNSFKTDFQFKVGLKYLF